MIFAMSESLPDESDCGLWDEAYRPALLAGVAIVEHTGPEMLKMLEGHTSRLNREKFIKATDYLVSPAAEWEPR